MTEGSQVKPHKAKRFLKDTLVTLGSRGMSLVLGMLISILIARGLGPDGKGIYTLVALFPNLLLTLVNLGIGPATIFHTAQKIYPLPRVLGSNLVLSTLLGAIGILVGVSSIIFFPGRVFPSVPPTYLLIALLLVPADLFWRQSGNSILLGAQEVVAFNAITVLYDLLFLVGIAFAVAVHSGALGVLVASIIASLTLSVVTFVKVYCVAGGVVFRPDREYVEATFGYGAQVYLGNVMSFLNYRIEIFLLGMFLPAASTGFYSVAVGMAEKLWLISQSAATVIFPMVSSEEDEVHRKAFTPLVSRTVLLVTALGAILVFALAQPLVMIAYGKEYQSTINLLRILLGGVVFLSASRILANDIAGRGQPMLNTYVGVFGLIAQVVLNLILIPRYGAVGSAWTTTIVYGLVFVLRLGLYTRLSGNTLAQVILPQRMDWFLYRRVVQLGWDWLKHRFVLSDSPDEVRRP